MEDRNGDVEGSLLRRVRQLLAKSKYSDLQLYKATGVTPSQQWHMTIGKTRNPSVNNVEKLFNFLTTSGQTIDGFLETAVEKGL